MSEHQLVCVNVSVMCKGALIIYGEGDFEWDPLFCTRDSKGVGPYFVLSCKGRRGHLFCPITNDFVNFHIEKVR